LSQPTRSAPPRANARTAGPFRLSSDARGGFRVETETGAALVEAIPDAESGIAATAYVTALGRLVRDGAFPGGFVIEEQGLGEDGLVGRTTREGGRAGLPASLLARDGRLFRVVARPRDEVVFELSGQEAPGASYLRARRSGDAYTIERTIAGRDLLLDPEILLLFAAEILDANS
jgi:hypothetical protein